MHWSTGIWYADERQHEGDLFFTLWTSIDTCHCYVLPVRQNANIIVLVSIRGCICYTFNKMVLMQLLALTSSH